MRACLKRARRIASSLLRTEKIMNCILQKGIWLAGASLLAIALGSGDANAVIFGTPGGEYIIPSTGYYDFTVAGANGGGTGSFFGLGGGNGAVVGGELFFDAGRTLDIVVGGGGTGFIGGEGYGGAGGGGSFVFSGGLLFAAGGGGGEGFTAMPGGPGIGAGGHPAGPASYGGGGGSGVSESERGAQPAQGGSFPSGGTGACCFGNGPNGGYGGGGGGGYNGGGGGGGAPGGAGGGDPPADAGKGGYSYVTNVARNAFGITGGNMTPPTNPLAPGANGYVSIDFVGSAVPEPSTWAMTIMGFAGLGWLARQRGRKFTPA
jgi:hypothetical protein